MYNFNNSVSKRLLLIGASTGGPGEIQKIISSIRHLNDTTIIIAQHMAKGFLPSYAKNLQENNRALNISLIEDKSELLINHVHICNGITELIKSNSKYFFISKNSENNEYNPDINSIFNSIVPYADDFSILCIIMTGIGNDGIDACKRLNEKNARCVTQTHESAVVDGMPSRARESIKNIKITDTNGIIRIVKEFCE